MLRSLLDSMPIINQSLKPTKDCFNIIFSRPQVAYVAAVKQRNKSNERFML